MDEELEFSVRPAEGVDLTALREHFSGFEAYEATHMGGENVLQIFLSATKPALEIVVRRVKGAFSANIIRGIKIKLPEGEVCIERIDADRLDDASLFAEEVIDALRRQK